MESRAALCAKEMTGNEIALLCCWGCLRAFCTGSVVDISSRAVTQSRNAVSQSRGTDEIAPPRSTTLFICRRIIDTLISDGRSKANMFVGHVFTTSSLVCLLLSLVILPVASNECLVPPPPLASFWSLESKTALVTGGTKGIGENSIAARCRNRHANLMVFFDHLPCTPHVRCKANRRCDRNSGEVVKDNLPLAFPMRKHPPCLPPVAIDEPA
jgi:hypothetical protein